MTIPVLIAKELSKALKANNVHAYVSRSITCQNNPKIPIKITGRYRSIALVYYDHITFDAYNESDDKDRYSYGYIASDPDFDPQKFVHNVVQNVSEREDIMLFITGARDWLCESNGPPRWSGWRG